MSVLNRHRWTWGMIVAIVVTAVGWSALTPGATRWLASRALVVTYALQQFGEAPETVEFGPAGRPPLTAAQIQSHIKSTLPGCRVRVAMTGSDWSPTSRQAFFHHDDLRSPVHDAFRKEAGKLLEVDSAFQLSDRVRETTRHGEPPPAPVSSDTDPLHYLQMANDDTPLTCRYFATIYGALAVQLGYTTRLIGLSRDGTSRDHAVCELYVPEFGKWILIDPDFNVAYRKDGVWLNAAEIQQEWQAVKQKLGAGLKPNEYADRLHEYRDELPQWTTIEMVVLGDAGRPLRQSNLHAGDGTGMNLEYFECIVYAARNDYLSRDYPWGHPTRWTEYLLCADASPPEMCPEGYKVEDLSEVYWPVGRTAIRVNAVNSGDPVDLSVSLSTWTPNFDRFEVRRDDRAWTAMRGNGLTWKLHEGSNRIAFRSVNLGGLRGEAAMLAIELSAPPVD